MNILYICQHNPFATTGGGGLASHAFLKAYCDFCNGNLDLICSGDLKRFDKSNIICRNIYYVQQRSLAAKLFSIFNGEMNRYTKYAKKHIREHLGEYDLIVFDHSSVAGPLVLLANKLGINNVTIHHNFEQEYYSDNSTRIHRLLYLRHVRKWERLAYRYSSINLFLTRQDKDKFENVYGKSEGKSFVIGVFEYYKHEKNKLPILDNDKITIIISGSLCNYQTVDGIKYFFNDLYALLPSDCKIIIAGRNPSIELQNMCAEHKNVELIANPLDINEPIKRSNIYLCPTKIGGGLKLRVMDGLKNGLPVITHSCSARGFDMFYESSTFKVFSTKSEFKKGLYELIELVKNDGVDREKIQDEYNKFFSYEEGLNRLNTIMDI